MFILRILIVGYSGSGKANSLFNLRSHQSDIDKLYLYAEDPYRAKCQFLIKDEKKTGTKHFNDSKSYIEYSI